MPTTTKMRFADAAELRRDVLERLASTEVTRDAAEEGEDYVTAVRLEQEAAELRLTALGWSLDQEDWPDRQNHERPKPYVWATWAAEPGCPVELMSYPWVCEDLDNPNFGHWMIMARTNPGDPGTLKRFMLRNLACFDRTRHEMWTERKRYYYTDHVDVWLWADELPTGHAAYDGSWKSRARK